MPKPVDEDHARRKELLEQKRDARKKAAREEQQLNQTKQYASEKATTTTIGKEMHGVQLLSLPDDAVHVIYSMLSATDLGRVPLTCKQLNIMLSSARTLYLLTRLSSSSSLQQQQRDSGVGS
jgi:hypothetical protein